MPLIRMTHGVWSIDSRGQFWEKAGHRLDSDTKLSDYIELNYSQQARTNIKTECPWKFIILFVNIPCQIRVSASGWHIPHCLLHRTAFMLRLGNLFPVIVHSVVLFTHLSVSEMLFCQSDSYYGFTRQFFF